MIKVICVNNNGYSSELIINKIYKAKKHKDYWRIYNNDVHIGDFMDHRFITLAEFREQRINKILND